MSQSKVVEFRHIRLEPADNGFILDYTEVREKPGSLDNRDFIDRRMVFTDSDEDLDAAMSKMKSMFLFNKIRKGGDIDVTPPIFATAVFRD